MIYLDNAATTKMDESLLQTYQQFACNSFFNPSANYNLAFENFKLLDEMRKVIIEKLKLKIGTVIFTSGATEANNLAIRGSLKGGKGEYLFSLGEHPSIFNLAKQLELEGKIIKFIKLQKNGQLDINDLKSNLNENTRFVSCMWVNNETGAINDIETISNIVKSNNSNTIFHIDAVQGFCKIPFNFSSIQADLISFSAHKFNGPKGIGGLYVKNLNTIKPDLIGGEQQFSKRAGTENLPAIVSMAKRINDIEIEQNLEKVKHLCKCFLDELLCENISLIKTNNPYILSLSFKGVNGETLMRCLQNDVIISTGSACSSKKVGNRVLEAMGYNKDYIKSSVRVSFDANQTVEEVVMAAKIIKKVYLELLEKVQ